MDDEDKEDKLVFGIGKNEDDTNTVLIGVPEKAWEHMKEGKTHNFDLTKVGIPIRFVMFGSKTHSTAKANLTMALENNGVDIVQDRTDDDFTIPKI